MKRIRFSLRGLILLVTALGLFLAVSQSRRREIHATAEQLRKESFEFVVADSLRDLIWQRRPVVGTVYGVGKDEYLQAVVSERKERNLVLYTMREFRGEKVERLKKLGVVEYD